MTSVLTTIARLVLGVAMIGVEMSHLTVQRQEFQAQVPERFLLRRTSPCSPPVSSRSGLGAAFMVLPKHRRTIGLTLAAFFVAIFPGNIAQYVEGNNAFGLDTDHERLLRLFFQPVLVLWALYGGGWLRGRDRS